MNRTDRFLIGLLAGVLILAAVAFALARGRTQVDYRADETDPEAVAFNYLLALQRQEDAKAYSYLDPALPGYPARLDVFIDDLSERAYLRDLGNRSFRVLSHKAEGDIARVTIQETSFVGGGLFQGDQSVDQFELRLQQKGDRWLLIDGQRSWWDCWDEYSEYCRRDGESIKPVQVP